jgi:hypothetical protein
VNPTGTHEPERGQHVPARRGCRAPRRDIPAFLFEYSTLRGFSRSGRGQDADQRAEPSTSAVLRAAHHDIQHIPFEFSTPRTRRGARALSFRTRFRTPFRPSSEPRVFDGDSDPARNRALRASRKQRVFRTGGWNGEPLPAPAQRDLEAALSDRRAPRPGRRHNLRRAPMLRRRPRDTSHKRPSPRPVASHNDSPRDSHTLCRSPRVLPS